MRALILDGSCAGDHEAVAIREASERELAGRGWTVRSQILRELMIAPCRGCFGCWTYSAGECIMDDDGRKVAAEMARADMWVYITPVTFGGFSSNLKRGLDRLIPILLPYFRRFEGETHHPSRYDKGWDILAFGIMGRPDEEAEECFLELVHRNALNSHARREAAAVLVRGTDGRAITEKVRSTLELAGVLA